MRAFRIAMSLTALLLAASVAVAQPRGVAPEQEGMEPGQSQSVDVRSLDAEDIRRVQQSLNEAGYDVGSVDGEWGAASRNALQQFQESKGIEPNGELNRETVLALGIPVSEFAAGEFAHRPLAENDVRQVQEALNRAGHKVGAVDGKWGRKTERALISFQKSKGIEPTGQLNQETVLALGLSVSEFAGGEFQEHTSE